MYRQMTVSSLVMDQQTNTPVVILKDPVTEIHLPIWIGLLEATSIATELEKIRFPRPMTHDLLKNVLEHLNVTVERIEVCDLRDNTYYALIHLRVDDKLSSIDSRPSDAIAIALRTNAPIFVREEVLQKSQKSDSQDEKTVFRSDDKEQWEEILDKLDPEDFGKYKM
ncbi:MAG: bifunctional nuclease family protein [Thermodesulfobacteriota bacterium]|nr:bifunctional nuclease family protein [Thermodesulfobacteriota bacterium]